MNDIQAADHSRHPLRIAVLFSSVFPILLGVTILLGWMIGSPAVVQLRPDLPAMHFNTALCFVLTPLALLAAGTGRRRAALLLGAVPALLGGATLLGIFFPPLSPDRLFTFLHPDLPLPYPARMAPVTAGCFLAAGAALLVANLGGRRRPGAAVCAGALVFAAGGTGLAGYALEFRTLAGWAPFTPVAVHTAFGFLFLGTALTISEWRSFTIEERAPAWITVAGGTASFLLWQAHLKRERALGGEESVLGLFILLFGLSFSLLAGRAVRLAYRARLSTRELERRVAERTAELAESEERFRLVFDQQFQFMAVLSPEGVVLEINELPLRMQGGRREEYIGKLFWDSPAWRDFPEWRRIWPARLEEAARMGGPLMTEDIYQTADGSVRCADAATTAVRDARGKTKFFIVQAVDVTERKKAEEELRDARDAAEAGSRAKDRFLVNMSHELRTPLTVIMGMLELALAEGAEPKPRRYLKTALQASETLLTLISDILDTARIEKGELILREEPLDLPRCVEEAVAPFRRSAQEKGVALELHLERGVPQKVVSDGGRLGQILGNLVENAVRFTDRGEVEITVRPGEEISGRQEVHFIVRDTGIGIPEGALGRLFKKFTQVDDSLTRRYGGSGLGLAISRGLVEGMGGRISAESRVGEGTRLSFVIPFRTDGDEAADEEAPPRPFPSSPPLFLSVLVGEDDPAIARLLQVVLEREGCRVDLAPDGRAVIEKWERGKYDLILMDLQMPGMDGLEATRLIRERESGRGARIPIVAMTAHARKEDEEWCRKAGMDDFLTKPVRLELLHAALAEVKRG